MLIFALLLQHLHLAAFNPTLFSLPVSMVNALLIENSVSVIPCLQEFIINTCPEVNISVTVSSVTGIVDQLRNSHLELLIIDIDDLKEEEFKLVNYLISQDLEVIFVTNSVDHALEAIKYGAAGYIVKPVKHDDLVYAVNHAIQNIKRKEEYLRNKQLVDQLTSHFGNVKILGIPTLEGFEFLHIEDIVRCEGLQKCTRIITTEKTDLISSYNLGEFCRILEPHGFFSPHKSHLINMKYISKYNREGSIILFDGSHVPVSKRRKRDFLTRFIHF
jgi:two-component system, LytTR family, response regulator